jgi:hypothetical protein
MTRRKGMARHAPSQYINFIKYHSLKAETMHDLVGLTLTEKINSTHDRIIKICAPLTNEEITKRPSKDAPPIGWHLWHISRWTDHLQGSFPNRQQIWEHDNYAVQWMLDTTLLGPMQTGMGMPVYMATETIEKIGKVRLLDYARLVFNSTRDALRGLEMEDLQTKRPSVSTVEYKNGQVLYADPKQTTLLADCVAHIAHAGRHLGMIEALIGATLDRPGTSSF